MMPNSAINTQLQNTSTKSESSTKRLANINWIIQLPRTDLEFSKKIKQVLITKTANNEEILIQYPGKETARTKVHRPWDFFPRIKNSDGYSKNLDFQNIWDILFDGLQPLIKDNQDWSAVVATLFYRMAFMNDHVLNTNTSITSVQELQFNDEGKESILTVKTEELPPHYCYSPNKLPTTLRLGY